MSSRGWAVITVLGLLDGLVIGLVLGCLLGYFGPGLLPWPPATATPRETIIPPTTQPSTEPTLAPSLSATTPPSPTATTPPSPTATTPPGPTTITPPSPTVTTPPSPTTTTRPSPTVTTPPSPTLSATPPYIPCAAARDHIGEYACVCCEIVRTYYASGTSGQPTFLNCHDSYRGYFTAVVWGPKRQAFIDFFGSPPESVFRNRFSCFYGLIGYYPENDYPEIELASPTNACVDCTGCGR